MGIKQLARDLFRSFGYHIERIDPTPESFKDQRRLVPDARLIIDGGANEGQTSLRYASLFPTATIHAFEPTPATALTLCNAVKHNQRVKAHGLGLADSEGRRSLNICRGSQINSLLPVAAGGDAYMGGPSADVVDSASIETVTLDAFCERKRIERIDILKLDIQGAEVMALRGAERLLSTHEIGLVYAEVLFQQMYDGQCWFDDVWRFLMRFDYRLFRFYNLTNSNRNLFLGYGDAIFVSPEVAASISRESFHRF